MIRPGSKSGFVFMLLLLVLFLFFIQLPHGTYQAMHGPTTTLKEGAALSLLQAFMLLMAHAFLSYLFIGHQGSRWEMQSIPRFLVFDPAAPLLSLRC